MTDGGDVPADDLVDGVGEGGAPAGVVKGFGRDGGLLVEPEPAALAAAGRVADERVRRAREQAGGGNPVLLGLFAAVAAALLLALALNVLASPIEDGGCTADPCRRGKPRA